MKIILIGANGSGKGTVAKLLGEKLEYEVITSSKVLSEEGLDITTGKLLPDDSVNPVIMNELEEKEKFILDGYPRTVNQFKHLIKRINKMDLMVILDISADIIISRAVGRRVCTNCNEIYNLNGFKLPKKEGVCDICGNSIVAREDDKEEVVISRYIEYMQKTYSVVTYAENNCQEIVKWRFDENTSTSDIVKAIESYVIYMDN